MPDLLMRSTSPYGTRRAVLLRGSDDIYLYLEDLTGEYDETSSAVWVANHRPVSGPPAADGAEDPGAPPRMAAGGTAHPEGCPPLVDPEFVWFEEGDGVALVDGEGIVAVVPGWAGRDGFYGYSRYAVGHTPIAWELADDAEELLTSKVTESRDFWTWRTGQSWGQISSTGLAHLDQAIGPRDATWPLGTSTFPEVIASRHRVGTRDIWVTATTGMSAQRMAGVEEYIDDPDSAARIELAIARTQPDQVGMELLTALAQVPFGRCTWLGEGHTVGGAAGSFPAFGSDRAALLLTEHPPAHGDVPPPDLRGLQRRGGPVTYLWVMLVDEETFGLARGRDSRSALRHLRDKGESWVQGAVNDL